MDNLIYRYIIDGDIISFINLVENSKIDINQKNFIWKTNKRFTPLELAIMLNECYIVQYLLSKHALITEHTLMITGFFSIVNEDDTIKNIVEKHIYINLN